MAAVGGSLVQRQAVRNELRPKNLRWQRFASLWEPSDTSLT
jgi:hypothetical protein